MVDERAEGWPRGRSWLILAIALAGVLPESSQAQAPKSPPAALKGEDAARAVAPPAASNEPPKVLKAEPEFWPEPNRQELLNIFEELHGPPVLAGSEAARVLQMAQGRVALDRTLVNKYIEHYAAELTKKAYLESLLDPQSGDKGTKALEDATNHLVRPLLEPEVRNNSAFRDYYIKKLVAIAPLMLKGHLHTRTFYMVVLSRSGSPLVVPAMISILKDPDQPATVKLLAAVGVTNATESGRRPIDAVSLAIPAAQAVSAYLEEHPDVFWPIRWRMLQTLGCLRMATANPLTGEAEFTAAPFEALTDRTAKPDVRAWGGWALGMIDVPEQLKDFNYDLVAYEIGQAAADIGTLVVEIPVPAESPSLNLRLVPRYVDPLLRLLSALAGEPGIRASGLENLPHVRAMQARRSIREIEQLVKAVAQRALELGNSVGTQIIPRHKALAQAVDDLKSYLAKNPPKNNTLYPDGPSVELPPEPRKVPAGAPALR